MTVPAPGQDNPQERLLLDLRESLDDPERDGYPWEHLGDAERDVRVLLDALEAVTRERTAALGACTVAQNEAVYDREDARKQHRRAEAAEQALADTTETFRLIAQAAGEDGTDPDDWRAMVFPTPGEYALQAVRQLRADCDDTALEAARDALREIGGVSENPPDWDFFGNAESREDAMRARAQAALDASASEDTPSPFRRLG